MLLKANTEDNRLYSDVGSDKLSSEPHKIGGMNGSSKTAELKIN